MPTPPHTEDELRHTLRVYREADRNLTEAARRLKIARTTMQDRLKVVRSRLGIDPDAPHFERDALPDPTASIEDILNRRRTEWQRTDEANKARKLINIKIKAEGPVGIVHFGDPHVDDPGTDIVSLERHLRIVRDTPGMFGANVGDMQNNWIGRLAHLWSQQATTASESWRLVEWMISYIDWLYLVAGNHDAWSGTGDPLNWMTRNQLGVFEMYGARLNLQFPSGRNIRINARHDFAGHSQYNTAHAPAKAAQFGWRDHILTCGHRHTSGYNIIKDPASGLISHAIRVASYKVHDRYASEKGLPDQNISPAVVTVIDPSLPDDHPGQITVIQDVEKGASWLTFERKRAGL